MNTEAAGTAPDHEERAADSRPSDDTMAAIIRAVALGHEGRSDDAREALLTLWDSLGPQGDPLHRCTLAHYLADLFDHPAEALAWDVRALDAAASLTNDRAKQFDPSLDVRGFYPSLHLNLADNYRRSSAFTAAHRELSAARATLSALPDTPYGALIRAAVDEVAAAIDAKDSAPRPSAPTGR